MPDERVARGEVDRILPRQRGQELVPQKTHESRVTARPHDEVRLSLGGLQLPEDGLEEGTERVGHVPLAMEVVIAPAVPARASLVPGVPDANEDRGRQEVPLLEATVRDDLDHVEEDV